VRDGEKAMAGEIADEEWEVLASESLDTATLLRAVDAIDGN
jgi:hypothetical protein